MNAKMSQRLTLLGLCAMVFYGALLAAGIPSLDIMPQFAVSALIFLTSGRLLRRLPRRSDDEEGKTANSKRPGSAPDWAWLTGFLNWTAALLILGVLAIFIMKPLGVSFRKALRESNARVHFFSTAVP